MPFYFTNTDERATMNVDKKIAGTCISSLRRQFSMDKFQFFAPSEVLFGKNVEAKVGAMCKKYGAHKVLVHFGGNSAKKSGLLDRVCARLKEAGL